jgi:homoserine O-acetyltransferase
MRFIVAVLALVFFGSDVARPAEYPKPVEGDFVIKDFKFARGEMLPEIRVHYRTLGQAQREKDGKTANAVLILHGTTGEGGNFLNERFAGELFGEGQPLDASRYFIIIPDNLGHGKSSKPSDGLHAKFPRYGYHDMVAAQHQLLTDGLKVNHLRLVMGTSMGGMHTWLWGQIHPEFMDALMPLASLPTQISGRNRMWRKIISEAIRTDPEWKEGDYSSQPRSLRFAAEMIFLMGSNPALRQKQGPTLKAADEFFEKSIKTMMEKMDANNVVYAIESSHDYVPEAGLDKIRAPLLAINFGDDLINPPELGILEKQIKLVKNGKAILIPFSDETIGHGTHSKAAVWKQHLEKLLKVTGH